LDFERQLDAHETAIVRRGGINRATAKALLEHRIALGLVKYPAAARYLVEHYDRLEGRVFEKKGFTHAGKHWYEYHRPRDPRLMLSRMRILSPTLVKAVRFSLDDVGYLSDHACLYLQPNAGTNGGYMDLRRKLREAVGRDVPLEGVLKYCLAFLNGQEANDRLLRGRRPTPKGFYQVTEAYLREVPIPMPAKRTAKRVLELVTRLTSTDGPSEIEALEKELGKLVSAML